MKWERRPRLVAAVVSSLMLLTVVGCGRLISAYQAFNVAPHGVMIIVKTNDVEPYREDGVESGTKLSIALGVGADIVRRANERFPGASNGFAVYIPAKDGVWHIRELVIKHDEVTATMVPVVAGWSRTIGYVPVSSYTAATRDRLAILDHYPCRDLRVSLLVDPRGNTYLSRFLPPKIRSAGLPCLSNATFESRGFKLEK